MRIVNLSSILFFKDFMQLYSFVSNKNYKHIYASNYVIIYI